MVNERSAAELKAGLDLTTTLATGHLHTPHDWRLSVSNASRHDDIIGPRVTLVDAFQRIAMIQ